MDARVYFQLTDSIADSRTSADLAAMRDVVRETPMHPTERRALERLDPGARSTAPWKRG